MAVTTTPRLGIKRWSASTDAWPGRPGWDDNQAALEDKAAIDLQDTFANRPAAAVRGRYYFATDTGRLYRDTGAAWVEVGPVGGVSPAALAFGSAGAEGVSVRAARADHEHPTPAHDNAAHSTVKLSALAAPDAAVPFGTQRITNLGAPAAATDAATRQYADDTVAALITAPGVPAGLTYGGAGVEGVASKAARADHAHPLPALPPSSAWATWAPTWTADTGVAPNIGNGTLTGRYLVWGSLCWFTINFVVGTGSTVGTGVWSFGLPPAAPRKASIIESFHALLINPPAPTDVFFQAAGIPTSNTFSLVSEKRQVTSAWPFTWVSTRAARISGFYEVQL